MSWVEVGCAGGLRPLVVGLWWLGCWVVVIEEVEMGFGCGFVVGSDWGCWGGGFWLRFVS